LMSSWPAVAYASASAQRMYATTFDAFDIQSENPVDWLVMLDIIKSLYTRSRQLKTTLASYVDQHTGFSDVTAVATIQFSTIILAVGVVCVFSFIRAFRQSTPLSNSPKYIVAIVYCISIFAVATETIYALKRVDLSRIFDRIDNLPLDDSVVDEILTMCRLTKEETIVSWFLGNKQRLNTFQHVGIAAAVFAAVPFVWNILAMFFVYFKDVPTPFLQRFQFVSTTCIYISALLWVFVVFSPLSTPCGLVTFTKWEDVLFMAPVLAILVFVSIQSLDAILQSGFKQVPLAI